MDVNDFDFEGKGVNTPLPDNNNNNNNIHDIDGKDKNDDITGKDGNSGDKTGTRDINNNGTEDNNNNNNNDSSTGELAEGDSIEFEGATYKVDANGNLVDDKGEIFKEAKDVKDWIASLQEDENEFDVASLQESLGITITDENGNAVEFSNDAEGVKSYVQSVIDLRSKELQEAAINKLYTDNPLLKQFTDYVKLTGSPRGFGELPDRSGIEIDKENIAQQEAIIRMAATEFGNKSLNENYIKYLKDSGALYDEAKTQLAALVDKDKQVRQDIAERAEAARQEEQKAQIEYWKKVNDVVTGRTIAGYKLPESFTKEVNGKKLVFTPKDFYDYLSKATETDENGNKVTGYVRDLSKFTEEETLNRELLDAWLLFTHGSYKDLVDMAVKENEVKRLRLKSQEQKSNKSIKLVKKDGTKANIEDIVL